MQTSLFNPELLTFVDIQDGDRRHLGFSSYVNLAHSGVFIVWCLSSVPNLVQISVKITEIDALCSLHSFYDVMRINFRFDFHDQKSKRKLICMTS